MNKLDFSYASKVEHNIAQRLIIKLIENLTGKPVITSNQAQFWSCLRRAGIKDKLVGFGKIFQENGLSIKKNS